MVSDIISDLQSAAKRGSRFGLTRTRALLDALSSPDDGLKIIHIAGTNGKGSTAAFISRILKSAGKRAGTFTSPAVYRYEEQFCIDCVAMPREKISEYLAVAEIACKNFADKPTAFETETAAALYAFKEEGCEYAVIECGLGGRDDATNAVNKKEVAVITSIGLEHTEYLGNTIRDICRAKSGIIRDCPVVVNALQEEEAFGFFGDSGAVFAGKDLKISDTSRDGQTFSYGGEEYKISLSGTAQCYNAATAVEVCKILGIGADDIKRGLEETVLAGRCEILITDTTRYILDGAHNPAAFAPLSEILMRTPAPRKLVYGCLSDKDVQGVARVLAGYFEEAILLSPDSYRAMQLGKIVQAFAGKTDKIRTARTVSEALGQTEGGTVAVCGSFTLLKEAKEWIEKRQ